MVESFDLVEHFEYMKNYIPQPFYIDPSIFKDFSVSSVDQDHEDKYQGNICCSDNSVYVLSKSLTKKLVDKLGIKNNLIKKKLDRIDVWETLLPVVNSLLKSYINCFVFYASPDGEILDLNMNETVGEEGTIYEHGPSPYVAQLPKESDSLTCFNNFLSKYAILDDDHIKVKATDILESTTTVTFDTFMVEDENATIQPMIRFSGKCSNYKKFNEILAVIYDVANDISIVMPTNYAKLEETTYAMLWNNHLKHIYGNFDLDDYLYKEMNEIECSNEVPGAIKKFITDLKAFGSININNKLRTMLEDCRNYANTLNPSKAKKFTDMFGRTIGWCLCMRHSSCSHCNHMSLI